MMQVTLFVTNATLDCTELARHAMKSLMRMIKQLCVSARVALFILLTTLFLRKLTRKQLSALGKGWHGDHLNCFHCGDGFPDGAYYPKDLNDGMGPRPFCESCFFDLYVPKCPVCSEPVTENGIVALGSTYHEHCFTCHTCNKPFGEEGFFEEEGDAYCAEHYVSCAIMRVVI